MCWEGDPKGGCVFPSLPCHPAWAAHGHIVPTVAFQASVGLLEKVETVSFPPSPGQEVEGGPA